MCDVTQYIYSLSGAKTWVAQRTQSSPTISGATRRRFFKYVSRWSVSTSFSWSNCSIRPSIQIIYLVRVTDAHLLERKIISTPCWSTILICVSPFDYTSSARQVVLVFPSVRLGAKLRATAVWASSLEGSSVRPPQRGGRTKKTNPRDLRALKRRKRLNRAKLQQTPERTYREDTADRKTTEYVTLHAVQVFLHVRE